MPSPRELFNGDVVKEVGNQIEAAFNEPETVEDHCFESLSMAEVVGTCLRESMIDHIADVKGIVGTGDDIKMADEGD